MYYRLDMTKFKELSSKKMVFGLVRGTFSQEFVRENQQGIFEKGRNFIVEIILTSKYDDDIIYYKDGMVEFIPTEKMADINFQSKIDEVREKVEKEFGRKIIWTLDMHEKWGGDNV